MMSLVMAIVCAVAFFGLAALLLLGTAGASGPIPDGYWTPLWWPVVGFVIFFAGWWFGW